MADCSSCNLGILLAKLLPSDFISSPMKGSEPGKATTTMALVKMHNRTAKRIPAAVKSENEWLLVGFSAIIH